MKRTVWMLGMLLAGTLTAAADGCAYWRVLSTEETVITAITSDGVLAWSNSVPGQSEQVQRTQSLEPPNWQDYVRVSSTDTTASVRAFDLNPPTGMALIPAGSFEMGNATNVFPSSEGYYNELPQHTVNVSAFYMDVYEVTKALWDEVKAFNGGNGYGYSNTGSGKATNHPVQTVNWYDVVKWCNARSQRDGLTPVYYTDAGFTTVYKTGEITPFANWAANGYRLPTEAEWEKAARGGAADTRFPWIDYTNKISWAKANYYGRSDWYSYDLDGGSGADHPTFATGGLPYTSPVGSFAPNGYGLYDMAGNVHEWCWDWYLDTYYASSPGADSRGPVSGSHRVRRSSYWHSQARFCRVAYRNGYLPGSEDSNLGFRLVRTAQ